MKRIYKNAGFYRQFLQIIGWERGLRAFISRLKLNLPEKIRILDVGCGTGIIGLSFMKKFPKALLLAVDIEKNFLKEILRNAKNMGIGRNRVSVGLSDLNSPEKVRFPGNSSAVLKPASFDIVCTGAAIGHAKNQKETIIKLLKLVKPEGYFINLDLNEKPLANFISSKFHYKILSPQMIRSILEKEGFEVKIVPFSVKDFPANLTRVCILARKKLS